MTIIQNKTRSSKKLSHLLKECRNEMNEMKYEIFDIQNALNACRTSLKNLNISGSTANLISRSSSPTIGNEPAAVQQQQFERIALPITVCNKNQTTKKAKKYSKKRKAPNATAHHRRNRHKYDCSYSTSLNNDSELLAEELELEGPKHTGQIVVVPALPQVRSRSSSSSSVTSSTADSTSYPSSLTYINLANLNPNSRYTKRFGNSIKTVKLARRNFNLNPANFNFMQSTTTSADETPVNTGAYVSARLKKFSINLTPVKYQALAASSPMKQKPLAGYNKVKVLNHCSQYQYQGRKLYRTSRKINPIYELNKSNASSSIEKRLQHMGEKSLIKFSNNGTSSISIVNKSEKQSSTISCSTNTLKDHFVVINHKQDLNQTIFEPKSASTPIYREPKTSTPDLLNTSHLENILLRLAASSSNNVSGENYTAVINGALVRKSTITTIVTNTPTAAAMASASTPIRQTLTHSKDSNKHSDYFSSSTNNNNDLNDYDIPEPRTCENEYQIPNTVKVDNETEKSNEETVKSDPSHKCDNEIKCDYENYQTHRVHFRTDSMKNLTCSSSVSSVRSSVIKCCIRPFKILYQTKNVKKCLKKI